MSRPRVVVVSGYVASGKSTIIEALARELGGATVLAFDHYEAYVEWPPDMAGWLAAGADPSGIRIPRLKADLSALVNGGTASDPLDGRLLSPTPYLLLEEPSGRTRDELRGHIDFVVFVDVPPDLCVARMIGRAIDMRPWRGDGTFAGVPADALSRQLDALARWHDQYLRARGMYLAVSQRAKGSADLIVDGMLPVLANVAGIIAALTRAFGNAGHP